MLNRKKVVDLESAGSITPNDLFILVQQNKYKKSTLSFLSSFLSSQPIWNANRLSGININIQNLANDTILTYKDNQIKFIPKEQIGLASNNQAGAVKIDTNSINPTVYTIESVNNLLSQKTSLSDFNNHKNDFSNPHRISPELIGAISITKAGSPLGVATLNINGKVNREQLPETLDFFPASQEEFGLVKITNSDPDPHVYTVNQVNSMLGSREPIINPYLSIEKGGTGASNREAARLNLGVISEADLDIKIQQLESRIGLLNVLPASLFDLSNPEDGQVISYNANSGLFELYTPSGNSSLEPSIIDGGTF